MRLDIGALSDIGRRKKRNEDSYGVYGEDTPDLALFDEGALLCVADGLGGHIAGEIASKLAVSVVKDVLKEARPEDDGDDGPPHAALHALLKQYVALANDNIFQTNRDLVTGQRPMGTTLLAALLEPRHVHVVNVGDSRCYHIRDGEIIDKTEDHSWVDEQVKLGIMTRAEADVDRRRNLVTRVLGTHPAVEPDTYLWHVAPKGILLLCSDGLVNMVKDADIAAEFVAGGSMRDIAQRLVDKANANGGKDNITVVVAQVHPAPAALAKERLKALWRKHGPTVLTLLLAGASFAAGFLIRPLVTD